MPPGVGGQPADHIVKRPIAYIAGTGRGLPATVMTNHDFAAIGVETSHDWIFERSGIVERRIANKGESTAMLASDAARRAMEKANVHAGDLDTIILSTATPDKLLPSTAVDVQAELGATRAAAERGPEWASALVAEFKPAPVPECLCVGSVQPGVQV